MIGGRRILTVLAALVLAASACSSSDGSASPSTTAASTGTAAPITTAAVPPPSTGVVGTTGGWEVSGNDETLVVVSGEERPSLVTLHSSADGSLLRSIDVDGITWFAYRPSATDERVIVNSNYEDFWFSCEGYTGIVQGAGADDSISELVQGGQGQLTADGAHLLYSRASDCGPDEVDPANWVHAPTDTIVWRELDTGTERVWTFPGASFSSEAPSPVGSVGLAGENIVAVIDGRLVTFDPAEPALPDVDTAPALDRPADEVFGFIGARPDGTPVAQVSQGTGEIRVVELDSATGDETEVASFANADLVALDRSGTRLAVLIDGTVSINGTEVELEGVDPAVITSIGW